MNLGGSDGLHAHYLSLFLNNVRNSFLVSPDWWMISLPDSMGRLLNSYLNRLCKFSFSFLLAPF